MKTSSHIIDLSQLLIKIHIFLVAFDALISSLLLQFALHLVYKKMSQFPLV